MFDYGTEAEHLADISDFDFNDDFEPYSQEEKYLYVKARGCCFSKDDVGKYVVIQNSRRNKMVMPTMYLVDRTKTKRMWWSPASSFAMVFEKRTAAEYQAKRYRFNKARVKQITPAMADREYFEQEYEAE